MSNLEMFVIDSTGQMVVDWEALELITCPEFIADVTWYLRNVSCVVKHIEVIKQNIHARVYLKTKYNDFYVFTYYSDDEIPYQQQKSFITSDMLFLLNQF